MSSIASTDAGAADDLVVQDDFVVKDDEEEVGGLFGSESEDEDIRRRKRKSARKLDDSDLDSGDDEGRNDRERSERVDDFEIRQRTAKIADMSIGTHKGPSPADGELYILSFPNDIGIESKAFAPRYFEPPLSEHHSMTRSNNFSALKTSNNTIRWRRSGDPKAALQANARINRWSDGSLTLQLASIPREQFELTAKALARPQMNPSKPTPTSLNDRKSSNFSQNARLDSYTYLAAPHEAASLIRHTNHATIALSIQSADQDDKALQNLQQGLAAATKGTKKAADGGLEVISINEDPENAKRRAELAEKEKLRMQRRLQAYKEREDDRANNVLRRSGLRGPTGLTIGDLEGDESAFGSGYPTSARKKRKQNRRNSEYSDEDDMAGRRKTREDEYDEDDGFLVGSDEDVEAEDGDDDEDEEPDFEAVRGVHAESRDEDDANALVGGRGKRRRVIDDDDDE